MIPRICAFFVVLIIVGVIASRQTSACYFRSGRSTATRPTAVARLNRCQTEFLAEDYFASSFGSTSGWIKTSSSVYTLVTCNQQPDLRRLLHHFDEFQGRNGSVRAGILEARAQFGECFGFSVRDKDRIIAETQLAGGGF